MDFKLDNIRRDRPTIPYSQFPRPNLQTYQSASYSTTRPRDYSPDANGAMDNPTSSTAGHRRRRSTLNGGIRSSPQNDAGLDESKWEDDDAPWSGDDSKSASEEHEMDDMSDDEGMEDEEAGLTGGDRNKKTARRRRNTLLDQRIAGANLTDAEKKEADQNVVKNLLINGVLIGLW